jgi:hypothetical protein
MSSYIKKLKNPKTGKMQKAYCIDDYFGSHIYGYGFRKDGKDANYKTLQVDFLGRQDNLSVEIDFYKAEELK